MTHQISDSVWKILICPNCEKSLEKTYEGCVCNNCQSSYQCTDSGSLDLRLQRPKKFQYEFELETPLIPESGFTFSVLSANIAPEVDFRNFEIPSRLPRDIMSYFPKAEKNYSLMLDLGCGNTIHREVCKHAGFEYVGLDYTSEKAPILGDAHSLPFKDESFEFILSIAVLEHLRFPFVAMKEAHRVLKKGGKFIGTVAFLEPFHGDSFYHHTHLGTYNSLHEGGFEIEHIAPSVKWSVLLAQARMLFPRMPHILSKSLLMPLQVFHKLWWAVGGKFTDKASEGKRILNTTGSFVFIARRQFF